MLHLNQNYLLLQSYYIKARSLCVYLFDTSLIGCWPLCLYVCKLFMQTWQIHAFVYVNWQRHWRQDVTKKAHNVTDGQDVTKKAHNVTDGQFYKSLRPKYHFNTIYNKVRHLFRLGNQQTKFALGTSYCISKSYKFLQKFRFT